MPAKVAPWNSCLLRCCLRFKKFILGPRIVLCQMWTRKVSRSGLFLSRAQSPTLTLSNTDCKYLLATFSKRSVHDVRTALSMSSGFTCRRRGILYSHYSETSTKSPSGQSQTYPAVTKSTYTSGTISLSSIAFELIAL